MFYIFVFLISSPVLAENMSRTGRFNIFGAINNIVAGISNFVNVMQSFKDVFNVVFSENPTNPQTNYSVSLPEDALLNISQLTTKYGYTLEEHTVTTEDGYILSLHRIAHGKRNVTKNNLTVFLMHGIIDSSDSWILQGPEKALGYILADEGFDVWMGNARGNKYALSHVKLNPKQSDFWRFTWEQIGRYDLPAMIDYALNVTEQESLYYVGHSQGTTSFYVMSSLKPEYNKKIKMMVSLSPVAWMRHAKSPIVRMFSPAYGILNYLLSNFNTYSPSTEFFNKITSVICTVMPNRCDNVIYMIIGSNKYVNDSMLPVILGHLPSGSSTLQFVHFGQLVQSGRFCRYDFGEEKNVRVYGQSMSPEYNLTSITVPIVLYYSGNDWLSDPNDVRILKSILPNVYDECYIGDYNHMDYMYATTAKDLVYLRIIEQIREFERNKVRPK